MNKKIENLKKLTTNTKTNQNLYEKNYLKFNFQKN